MEANRWYMCKHDLDLGYDIIFKQGKIYFFEPQGNTIATIDEVGDSYYFSDNYKPAFNDLFRLATNEEIHNANQVVFKDIESQVLTKREQIAARTFAAILSQSQYNLALASLDGCAKLAIVGTDALLKALNESRS